MPDTKAAAPAAGSTDLFRSLNDIDRSLKLEIKGDDKEEMARYIAAAKHDPRAAFKLFRIYFRGIGGKEDLDLADIYIKRVLANKTFPDVQYAAGNCFFENNGAIKNYVLAANCYEVAVQQCPDHLRAELEYRLGYCYESMEKFEQAFTFFSRAAQQNHARSLTKVAACHEMARGTKKDWAKAFHFYQEAAKHNLPEAHFCIALCYEQGIGTLPNPELAFVHFDKGVETSQRSSIADYASALYHLARCYEFGIGIEINDRFAMSLYKNSHVHGFAAAQARLDKREADAAIFERYYQAATEKGDADAQYQLAVCYQRGIGVAKDKNLAAQWFCIAALQGHKDAHYQRGICYLYGYGITKNIKAAIEHFQAAGIKQLVIVVTFDIDDTLINFITGNWNGGKTLWQKLCQDLKDIANKAGIKIVFGAITAKNRLDSRIADVATTLHEYFFTGIQHKGSSATINDEKSNPNLYYVHLDNDDLEVKAASNPIKYRNTSLSANSFIPIRTSKGLSKLKHLDDFTQHYKAVLAVHTDDAFEVRFDIESIRAPHLKVVSAAKLAEYNQNTQDDEARRNFHAQQIAKTIFEKVSAAIGNLSCAQQLLSAKVTDQKASAATSHSTFVIRPTVASPIAKPQAATTANPPLPSSSALTASAPAAKNSIG